ncbi:MAG: hypothetical protein RL077_4384, partial [Verrucomicrobiota bacterium]
ALTHFTDNFRRIAARSRREETRFREHRLTRNERWLQLRQRGTPTTGDLLHAHPQG